MEAPTGVLGKCDDLEWPDGVFGGKADSLFKLTRAGFRVPRFFAVSAGFCDEQAVVDALAHLNTNSFAVRSSGLGEDSVECAMAGVNDTLLKVERTSVWAAVERVQRSSRTEKSIPVIIQDMIVPTVAGVAFSRHPVTGANVVVVNAGKGLGEAIVSGHVDPKQLVFERGTRKMRETSGPSLDVDVHSWDSLVDHVLAIERAFEMPIDVEWALEGPSTLWILQARPITTLAGLIAMDNIPEGTVFANDHTKEVMGHVLSPLTWTAFRHIIDTAMQARCRRLGFAGFPEDQSYYQLIHGRLYQNVNITFELYKQEFGSLSNLEALAKEFSSVPSDAFMGFQESSALVAPAWRMMKMIWNAQNRAQDFENQVEEVKAFYELHFDDCPFEEALRRLTVFGESYIEIQIYCFMLVALLEAQQGGSCGALPFISHIDGVETAEQAAEFSQLIKYARQHGISSPQFCEKLKAFQRKWGFRAVSELEIASPRWGDDASYLLETIEAQCKTAIDDRPEDPPAPIPSTSGLKALLVERTRRFCRLRENSKAAVVRLLAICRARAIERARDELKIHPNNDVFFLTLDEFLNPPANKVSDIMAAARRRCEQFDQGTAADAYVVRDGAYHPLRREPPPLDPLVNRLKGVVASAPSPTVMVVQGRARLILDPRGGHVLEKGDVLLCQTTDPAWTLLFFQCSAVVSERGGILSHAAITAREMRIPCLVGVTGLVDAKLDGKMVTVNLQTGHIEWQ